MRSPTTSLLLGILLLLLVACHPRIYQFNVDPRSIGPDDPVKISWSVKGIATLQIHDYNYPGSGAAPLPPITLLVIRNGQTTPYLLLPDSTIRLPLPTEDSLTLVKKPDNNTNDILRYITLVASRKGKDSSRVVQVAVRPDSVSDEIGFRVTLHGDTLVAAGTNNLVRWGDEFMIGAVGSNRSMTVVHAGISRQIRRGNPPDYAFKGTPVKGDWSFSSFLTPEESNDRRLIPNFLKLTITIKHR